MGVTLWACAVLFFWLERELIPVANALLHIYRGETFKEQKWNAIPRGRRGSIWKRRVVTKDQLMSISKGSLLSLNRESFVDYPASNLTNISGPSAHHLQEVWGLEIYSYKFTLDFSPGSNSHTIRDTNTNMIVLSQNSNLSTINSLCSHFANSNNIDIIGIVKWILMFIILLWCKSNLL